VDRLGGGVHVVEVVQPAADRHRAVEDRGAASCTSTTPAKTSALTWATMPNSSNGPVAPPIGQLEIASGTRRLEISISFAAVSSTTCKGLLITQVMNDRTGFSWKASFPPETIWPIHTTSSRALSMIDEERRTRTQPSPLSVFGPAER
jgi:hypothetical protein